MTIKKIDRVLEAVDLREVQKKLESTPYRMILTIEAKIQNLIEAHEVCRSYETL